MKEAIEKVKGPCVILAGAGTGKTYTIVEKIKYLLEKKIYPTDKIVCLTFSNEAVNALRARILPHIQSLKESKEPIIRTFHSFCADLLREHGLKVQIDPSFKIIEPDEAKIMFHKNFKLQPHYCHTYVNLMNNAKDLGIQKGELQSFFESKMKELGDPDLEKVIEELTFSLHTIDQQDKEKKKLLKDKLEQLIQLINIKRFLLAWNNYDKIKERKKWLDYTDLQIKALELLKKFPYLSTQYGYIIVDEFQDTNKIQCDFLQLLCPHKNITVVGDLNQSIYQFRGAYKENFSLFKKIFDVKNEDVFALQKSFRSPDTALALAHQLICHNYDDPAQCFQVLNAHARKGEPAQVFQLKDTKEEVRKIIEIIEKEKELGTPYEEICVMFRTHQQSKMLKQELEQRAIPFSSVTKKSLLKTSEIKKVMAYLTILNKLKTKSKGGESAWWELLYRENFEDQDFLQITQFINDTVKKNTSELLSVELLNKIPSLELTEEGKIKATILTKKIKDLIPFLQKPLPELITEVYKTAGYYDVSEGEKTPLVPLLERFLVFSKEYDLENQDLENFLSHLETIEALGLEVDAPQNVKEGVRIMTSHATKGLEFKVVVITHLVQKKFPSEKISRDNLIPVQLLPAFKERMYGTNPLEIDAAIEEFERKNQLLEERRLCYVALTRTKDRLYLTYAKEYGGKEFEPSQFLKEIKYEHNNKIIFTQDLEEKYIEKEVILQTAKEIEAPKEKKNLHSFSQSALITFTECQKKYEYKYVYHMPEKPVISWQEMKLGSFVHKVIESGVQKLLKTEEEFTLLAKELQMQEEWNFIVLQEALPLIKVFVERNKHKYDEKSLAEQKLYVKLQGIQFMGIADRIDFHDEGVEVIDYKTGKSSLTPKQRNWQLGLYALAAAHKYGTVRRVTLDMLRHEKPLEFEINPKGEAVEINSKRMSFNLLEVQKELVETAQQILNAYEKGFKVCAREKDCEFCEEYGFKRL